MTSTLVDTNVLLDVIEQRVAWHAWAVREIRAAMSRGRIVINQIIYSEASVPYLDAEEFDAILNINRLVKEDIPWRGAFLAGKAFLEYRRRGGVRNQGLPDFFIGAHASVNGYRLLTRDATRYRTYFPEVSLIAPDSHP